MLTIPASVRVFACREPVSMQCSFDGLAAKATHILKRDPLSGHLFLFLNRARTHAKILYYDQSGWTVWYRRLERGTFSMPSSEELSYRQLMCILEGIVPSKETLKSRYYRDFFADSRAMM